jgi:uncharacterized protein (TIGR03083 family)
MMNRDEILKTLRDSRARMEAALEGVTDAQMVEPGALDEWSLKDVLFHLTAWEAEAVTVLAKVKRGVHPGKVAWTDSEVDAQNAKWYKENKNRPLEKILADFHAVRKQMIRQVESLSAEELSAPRPWINNRTLARLIQVYTFEHETEHCEQILEWRQKK